MKPGELVKFKSPSPSEAGDRFKVIEMRGERVLVEALGFESWAIKPQAVYLAQDLEIV